MKRRFYSIFNITFIRGPYEITATKCESVKNFIQVGGDAIQQFLISLSNAAVSHFAPLKTMKGSNFVPSAFAVRQNKTRAFSCPIVFTVTG